MLKVKHVPEQLLDVTITPVMFTLMFTYLFGGAIAGSTDDYLALHPARHPRDVGDLHDRLLRGRAEHRPHEGRRRPLPPLPIWRPAPLVGALLGDSVRYVLAGTVIIVVGVILGYRPPRPGSTAWSPRWGWSVALRVRPLVGLHHDGTADALARTP